MTNNVSFSLFIAGGDCGGKKEVDKASILSLVKFILFLLLIKIIEFSPLHGNLLNHIHVFKCIQGYK